MAYHRSHPVLVLVTTVVCALGTNACGVARNDSAPAVRPTPSHGDYFQDDSFIGTTVTVTGIVIRVITETSFVLDLTEVGDQAVLVLSAPAHDVAVNYRVTLTGEVQKFAYRRYADDYALAPDRGRYQRFDGDRFLVSAGGLAVRPTG